MAIRNMKFVFVEHLGAAEKHISRICTKARGLIYSACRPSTFTENAVSFVAIVVSVPAVV